MNCVDNLKKSLLEKLYSEHGTITAVAKFLDMNRKTLNAFYRSYNIEVKKGHPKYKKHKKWNALMKWYEKNKTTLPRSLKKISKLSGCSYNLVKCYFYRRRKEIKDFIKNLNIQDLKTKIPFKHSVKYYIAYDKFTMKLKITLYLKPKGKRKLTYYINKEDLK